MKNCPGVQGNPNWMPENNVDEQKYISQMSAIDVYV